jgi:ParB-like chromosome segregation protein Spo0J
MSDIESGLEHLRIGDDPPIVPAREGLPPRYRMRADAHYVEQLDSPPAASSVRLLEARSIEAPRQDADVAPSRAFVESVRKHGVLQPLLVRSRGGRHQIIAGRKRLAAALAAGLKDVPCLVERVDDDAVQVLAAATNVAAVEKVADDGRLGVDRAQTEFVLAALAECLTAVASSANLLSTRSTLTQAVAADLVRAEAARALHLSLAGRVLASEAAPVRRGVAAPLVAERAIEATAAEWRLRGGSVTLAVDGAPGSLRADEDMLNGALAGVLLATCALVDGARRLDVALRVRREGDRVTFSVSGESAMLMERWRSRLMDGEWLGAARSYGPGSGMVFVLLQAARRIAELHGGRVIVESAGGTSTLSLVLPAGD